MSARVNNITFASGTQAILLRLAETAMGTKPQYNMHSTNIKQVLVHLATPGHAHPALLPWSAIALASTLRIFITATRCIGRI